MRKKRNSSKDSGERFRLKWFERGKPVYGRLQYYTRAQAHEWAQILGMRKYTVEHLTKAQAKQLKDEAARLSIIDAAHELEKLIGEFAKRLRKERRIAILEFDAVEVEIFAKGKGKTTVLATLGPT